MASAAMKGPLVIGGITVTGKLGGRVDPTRPWYPPWKVPGGSDGLWGYQPGRLIDASASVPTWWQVCIEAIQPPWTPNWVGPGNPAYANTPFDSVGHYAAVEWGVAGEAGSHRVELDIGHGLAFPLMARQLAVDVFLPTDVGADSFVLRYPGNGQSLTPPSLRASAAPTGGYRPGPPLTRSYRVPGLNGTSEYFTHAVPPFADAFRWVMPVGSGNLTQVLMQQHNGTVTYLQVRPARTQADNSALWVPWEWIPIGIGGIVRLENLEAPFVPESLLQFRLAI